MDIDIKRRTQELIHARLHNPAWQLLAARRSPLVLSCLQYLFEKSRDGIAFEDAQIGLADLLELHANNDDFNDNEDFTASARKELRDWIKRGLIVEREGNLYATDALEAAMRFTTGLGDRIMTSTASRLSMVQREIESLQSSLNPDPRSRADHIKRKIAELEAELEAVNAGHVRVLPHAEASERIREIYGLATSLRADFRRVEDSYREADRRLRQSIVSEKNNRGDIVDKMLNSHDSLLETSEGRVFQSFQLQLSRSVELQNMKVQLRAIATHPVTSAALNRQQQTELRWLLLRLVEESAGVIRARARSERDVKGFLKTGLAAEHHRVGELINEVLQEALDVDWSSVDIRRASSPIPPVAVAFPNLPLIERLRFKVLAGDEDQSLELVPATLDLTDLDEDFWDSLDGLDRQALVTKTLEVLDASEHPMGIAELAERLPPTHDLETLALWLGMAREVEAPILEEREQVNIIAREGVDLRFDVPRVQLEAARLREMDWEV